MPKMIGVRVPDESDLPQRLKALSERTNTPYHKLLEQWILEGERAAADKANAPARDLPAEISELASRVESLEQDVHAILPMLDIAVRQRFKSPAAITAAPIVDNSDEPTPPDAIQLDAKHDVKHDIIPIFNTPEPAAASITTIDVKQGVKQDVKQENDTQADAPKEEAPAAISPGTDKAATLARISALKAEGLTLSGIAARLEAENVPTLRGGAKWNTGTLSKLLRQLPDPSEH